MSLSIRDMRSRAHTFVKTYVEAVKENAEAQSFLNDFFEIFGISRRRVASFESPVKINDGTKRIDLFWPGVLLVEMKSYGKDLDSAFTQGLGYFAGLKDKDLPRYIMVCDLTTFRLHDLDRREEYQFELHELVDNLDLFAFMHGKEMQEITEYELNERAALLLGSLHDALEQSGYSGHSLQVFMVRILFCMFAEDTGVFNPRSFTQYLLKFTNETGIDTAMHLQQIFQVLDTPEDKRSAHLPDELATFPYVNGHLFEERIDMPMFTSQMRNQLIECCYFNWQDISPAVFGSLFQSIMDKETRRNLGAHYTSEENILKVIEPLFLTELRRELDAILLLKQTAQRNKRLQDFIGKIRNLTFFDPACGCGNFLIITYREMRRLELDVLKAQQGDSLSLGLEIQPAIPLNNFYGIEIDEWPARIAEVAMWLTQHQMNVEFAKDFGEEPDLLPLREHAEIHNANALTLDWAAVVAPEKLSFIIGNPPFVGHQYRSKEQQEDMKQVFPEKTNFGKLDFVASWFYKAAEFMQGTQAQAGLVSTNSITMGEQTATLWQPMLDMGIKINFAHRTFQWHNDARGKAAVHCVIVGFAHYEKEQKFIFDYPDIQGEPLKIAAENINPYLIDAADIILPSRSKSPKGMPAMTKGSQPTDGGFLVLNDKERAELINNYPQLEQYIKPYIGGREWINNIERYCLWFADASPRELAELKKLPEINRRLEGVKAVRLTSPTASVKEYAHQPFVFTQNRQPKTSFIAVPEVSSERRTYIPMGFLTADTVPSNQIYTIPDLGIYEFGVLISEIHMDWMRTIAGRLKSDYRYSPNIYHIFPWPAADDAQKAQIEKLAQAVLDARESEFAKDPATSLADLYDPDLMPPSLRKAHQNLDKAVDKLYSAKGFKTPLERVKHLFEQYKQLTAN